MVEFCLNATDDQGMNNQNKGNQEYEIPGGVVLPEGVELPKIRPERWKDVFKNANSFKEAWYHPDPFQRAMWRAGIRKELLKMKMQRVMQKILRSNMPAGRRCVKCKWVFEVERNGVFRARLVACGYSQIPGVDFQEVYAPVVSDVTVRVLLVIMLVLQLSHLIIDVETAFLHGVLGPGEEIYMECPEGIPHTEDEVTLLTKTIYGLVQSGRTY